jgi:hypothetical protein
MVAEGVQKLLILLIFPDGQQRSGCGGRRLKSCHSDQAVPEIFAFRRRISAIRRGASADMPAGLARLAEGPGIAGKPRLM